MGNNNFSGLAAAKSEKLFFISEKFRKDFDILPVV